MKSPKTGRQLAVQVPSEPLSQVETLLRQQGIVEWTIKSKPGRKTISGRTTNGGAVRYQFYSGNGFRERTSSSCDPLPPQKRRAEAKRMTKEGLTQTEIAERLGCSQKTVSNDLRSGNAVPPRARRLRLGRS
jgi:hypothetical protein